MSSLDFLLKPQQIEKEITCLCLKQEVKRSQLEKTVTTIQLAPGHGNGIRRRDEDILAEIDLIGRQIEKKQLEMEEAKAKCKAEIARLGDPLLETILELRYIDCLEWEEIAKSVCYGRTRTFELHNLALNALKLG